MAQVLLLAKDWQSRALLRAQLIEEGLDVEAHATAAEAQVDLATRELLPMLIVADLASSDEPAAEAELLAAWAKQVPVWVIASRTLIVDKSLKGRGFEMIFFRPVDIGELVDQIKQRVET